MGNDCNANGMLDECDIKGDASTDENANGTPDECEVPPFRRGDCNDDGDVDIADPLATLFAIFLGEFEIECDDA